MDNERHVPFSLTVSAKLDQEPSIRIIDLMILQRLLHALCFICTYYCQRVVVYHENVPGSVDRYLGARFLLRMYLAPHRRIPPHDLTSFVDKLAQGPLLP